MRLMFFSLVICTFLITTVTAKTWLVPDERATIQLAVDDAAAGDTIQLTAALYTGPGNTDIDISGKSLAFQSATGNPDDCVIDGENTPGSYAFQLTSGDVQIGFQGLTIRRCERAIYVTSTSGRISIEACKFQDNPAKNFTFAVTIRALNESMDLAMTNCEFTDNGTPSSGGAFQYQSAFGSSFHVDDCIFMGTIGQAVYVQSSTASPVDNTFSGCRVENTTFGLGAGFVGNIQVSNCQFKNNGDDGGVGGGGGPEYGPLAFTDCQFKDNVSGGPGGGFNGGNATFDRCVFSGNTSTNRGGAIDADGATIVMRDSEIFSNSSRMGGAIWVRNGSVEVLRSSVYSNQATESDGGAFWVKDSDLYLRQSVVANNRATDLGGAIYSWGGNLDLEFNTLSTNACGSSGGGSGLYLDSGYLEMDYSIVSCGLNGAGITCVQSPSLNIECSNVFGNAGGDWSDPCLAGFAPGSPGRSNVSVDPMFCGPESVDFGLASGSPMMASENSCGIQIGAKGLGCSQASPSSCSVVSIQQRTWGGLKALYR